MVSKTGEKYHRHGSQRGRRPRRRFL